MPIINNTRLNLPGGPAQSYLNLQQRGGNFKIESIEEKNESLYSNQNYDDAENNQQELSEDELCCEEEQQVQSPVDGLVSYGGASNSMHNDAVTVRQVINDNQGYLTFNSKPPTLGRGPNEEVKQS